MQRPLDTNSTLIPVAEKAIDVYNKKCRQLAGYIFYGECRSVYGRRSDAAISSVAGLSGDFMPHSFLDNLTPEDYALKISYSI